MAKRFYANRRPMSMLSSKNFRAQAFFDVSPLNGLRAGSHFADVLRRLNFQ